MLAAPVGNTILQARVSVRVVASQLTLRRANLRRGMPRKPGSIITIITIIITTLGKRHLVRRNEQQSPLR